MRETKQLTRWVSLKKSQVITSVINLLPMKVMYWKQTDLLLL